MFDIRFFAWLQKKLGRDGGKLFYRMLFVRQWDVADLKARAPQWQNMVLQNRKTDCAKIRKFAKGGGLSRKIGATCLEPLAGILSSSRGSPAELYPARGFWFAENRTKY